MIILHGNIPPHEQTQISIHYKVKSEQHLVITSSKRVGVFQGSLKVEREKA